MGQCQAKLGRTRPNWLEAGQGGEDPRQISSQTPNLMEGPNRHLHQVDISPTLTEIGPSLLETHPDLLDIAHARSRLQQIGPTPRRLSARMSVEMGASWTARSWVTPKPPQDGRSRPRSSSLLHGSGSRSSTGGGRCSGSPVDPPDHRPPLSSSSNQNHGAPSSEPRAPIFGRTSLDDPKSRQANFGSAGPRSGRNGVNVGRIRLRRIGRPLGLPPPTSTRNRARDPTCAAKGSNPPLTRRMTRLKSPRVQEQAQGPCPKEVSWSPLGVHGGGPALMRTAREP